MKIFGFGKWFYKNLKHKQLLDLKYLHKKERIT